jgi:hypothetical protein
VTKVAGEPLDERRVIQVANNDDDDHTTNDNNHAATTTTTTTTRRYDDHAATDHDNSCTDQLRRPTSVPSAVLTSTPFGEESLAVHWI